MKSRKYCELGKIIAIRLVEINQNMQWLSDKVDLTPAAISNYCTGKCTPSLKSLRKIAIVLNVELYKLVNAVFEEKEQEVS